MDNLTDFTDTSDVSDAAIEWVLRETTSIAFTVASVRSEAASGYPACRTRIIAARLIQQHRPDLLVDPVDEIVREELAKACEELKLDLMASCFRAGREDTGYSVTAAKRLYLMGIEKGKQS